MPKSFHLLGLQLSRAAYITRLRDCFASIQTCTFSKQLYFPLSTNSIIVPSSSTSFPCIVCFAFRFRSAFTLLMTKPFGYWTPERFSDLSKAGSLFWTRNQNETALAVRRNSNLGTPKLKEFSPYQSTSRQAGCPCTQRRSALARALTDFEASKHSNAPEKDRTPTVCVCKYHGRRLPLLTRYAVMTPMN